jgi:hypothetical protein
MKPNNAQDRKSAYISAVQDAFRIAAVQQQKTPYSRVFSKAHATVIQEGVRLNALPEKPSEGALMGIFSVSYCKLSLTLDRLGTLPPAVKQTMEMLHGALGGAETRLLNSHALAVRPLTPREETLVAMASPRLRFAC